MKGIFLPIADMDAFDTFWTANEEAFAEIGINRALALELAKNCSLTIGGGAAPLFRIGFVD